MLPGRLIAADWAFWLVTPWAGPLSWALQMVGVTLLYRQGYLKQSLDEDGNQQESAETWHHEEYLEALSQCVGLPLRVGGCWCGPGLI